MNNFLGFWIFLAIALSQANNVSPASVNVTVLYESLCPDSMRFMRKQLLTAYNDLKDYMNLELVPYGKAHYETNPWRITCQHGPQECLGNAIQGCALARYTDPQMQANWVHCVMSDNYPPAVGAKCARQFNYPYDQIEECARSDEGKRLLTKLGDRTMEFKSDLRFVPTIIFNNKFDDDLQNKALRNLKSAVCEQIGEPELDACR